MDKLIIETLPSNSRAMETKKITGFKDGELRKLKMKQHEDAKQQLLNMLDERNGRIGTCWHNGPGIFGIWFDNEAAYVNIGRSCD